MTAREIIISFIFFTAITLIFFYKVFLGLIPLPADLIVGAYHPWINYKWGNYVVGVPVQNPKLSDAVSIYYPLKSLVGELVKEGELPLWNPYMFGGYPLFANVQVGSLFPTMIFYLLFSSHIAWTLQVMSQPLLAAFFMYLLLRHLSLRKLPSIFGGIVYGFGGSTILWIQWNTQATTSIFLPILILLEDKYLITKKIKWGVILSIFSCLQLLAGYLPVIPFTFLAMTLWFLFRSKSFLSNLKILFFIALGISLSAIFLLPVAELIKISQRTVEVLDRDVPFFAPENLINLIAPDFFGNPATGNFWGRGDNMDMTIYTGVVTLIFSLLAFRKFLGKSQINFAVCLILLTLIIIIPNPVSIFLYKLGLWGGPSITMNRANFLINFSLAILGSFGFSLITKDSKLSLKPIVVVISISLGVLIGLMISRFTLLQTINSSNFPTADIDTLLETINISLRNLILPFLVILANLLLFFFVNRINKVRSFGQLLFILLLIFELFRFGLKFNTFSDADLLYPETPISKFLKQYPTDRFIAETDVFPANMWVPFKLSSIQGYDGIYPLNIAFLLAAVDLEQIPKPRWGIVQNFNSKILDVTNTRFLVAVKRDNQGKVSSNGEFSFAKSPKFEKVFEDRGVAILKNTSSLPRAYITKQVIKASDDETLKLLKEENFPIETSSISDEFEYSNKLSENLKADAIYTPITNSHVLIKTTSNLDAYLVVLDTFFPGWEAKIDGKATPIYRTNYSFKGMMLPKGNHIVELIYNPDSIKYGAIISVLSLIMIVLILFFPLLKRYYDFRQNR